MLVITGAGAVTGMLISFPEREKRDQGDLSFQDNPYRTTALPQFTTMASVENSLTRSQLGEI
jgi:hypothetical protein